MKVVYDLIAGGMPPLVDLMYNGDLDVDSVTKRYKGSLVKMMDVDNIDNGKFHTFAGVATVLENISGILEEEQGITGNYLPNDGTYSVNYRKITPLFPSSVIEAEYARADAAAAANTDTGATGSAASATFTITVTEDEPIGGWVYFLTGSNAGYLHYITDTTSTTSATLSPVLKYAVASADTFLHIAPACTNALLIDATYTGLKSEIALAARTCFVNGLSTWIEAQEIGKTKLDFAKHAGLKISGAKFYHQFTLTGAYAATPNYWIVGQKPT